MTPSWLPPRWRPAIGTVADVPTFAVLGPTDDPTAPSIYLRLATDERGLRSSWVSLCARAWQSHRQATAEPLTETL